MTGTAAALIPDLQMERNESTLPNESAGSGVSWAAVAGGAFVAAALSLILLALGAGFGLSSVSPWSNAGVSASAVGAAGIVWLIAMQAISSAMGGYIAGRLRTKWAKVHSDEVYFRDTAHGLLVWSVGLVMTASFLASAALSMVGGAASPAATQTPESDSNGYFVDSLFRSERPATERIDAATHAEAGRILTNAIAAKDLPAPDRTYLSQLIAGRTGISQPEADKRVSDVFTAARQAVDNARKAGAHLLLWLFVALLIGAFCASYAATIGGMQRDAVRSSQ